MKITSSKLHTSHLSLNEAALHRCRIALDLKDKGDYQGAREAMGPLWSRVGERPETNGLHPPVAAEVLLCSGALLCWMGSKGQVTNVQEAARDFITESIRVFESVGDQQKIASAHAELGYCYWCDGALNEARIMFQKALQKLTTPGNTRARALLGLAVVEWADSQLSEARRILTENASLFSKITNHAIIGAFHSQMANVLLDLATAEKRNDYLQVVIDEYEKADDQFRLARNVIFRADVKNNVGFLLYKLSRFKKAHDYLQEARRLRVRVRDKIGTAQIDDTRANVFIAQNKFKEAEAIAKNAVRVLERSGHQCLLTDALITHGISLARLKQFDRARFTVQKAIEVAHQVGALNKAGLAALTMIEELDELTPEASYAAYERASEWLTTSQSQDILLRLNAAAKKIFAKLSRELNEEDRSISLTNRACDLHAEVLKFEGRIIRQALAQSNGSVTRAALLLGLSYQGLAYIIASRHTDLLKERSPVRRRSRKDSDAKAKVVDKQEGTPD
ncbi:MAG TPA: tetratricopeptide repeat protein [Pyrinomonadaceae bacterium]|nr:tetratricopeptide repeat protein [Pyrinomonadaceae bacterium]